MVGALRGKVHLFFDGVDRGVAVLFFLSDQGVVVTLGVSVTHIVAFKVVPTGLASALDCLLLHVIDRVADKGAYRLAVLALLL